MERIDPVTAKEIVKQALTEIADFSGDFEDFTFKPFKPFHTKVFLNSIRNQVIKTPCSDQFGNIVQDEFFDLDLSQNLYKKWNKIRDCMDYVTTSHYRVSGNTNRIMLP
jgi:hypothetical protein